MRLDAVNNADWIDGELQIPELLRSAPQVRPVLDRYGLRGCGGPLGPRESLDFFARAHEVPLDVLLGELRTQVVTPRATPRPPAPAANSRPEDTIYRPFFKAGMLVVLSLGAVWGAYLLLRIAWQGSFTAAGIHEVNAHGHAQIFGWVGLFVMGFAYQAFPRFKHTDLAWPRLAWATLWLMLAGLIGRSVAEPLAVTFAGVAPVAVVAAWLEVVAIILFATVVLATWRASGKGLAFYDYYILAALGWFIVQAVYEALYLRATLAAGSTEELVALVAGWQGAMREAQIHGFALLMILGVSQRLLHHFYGLQAPSRRLSLIVLGCLNLAVVCEMAGLILMRQAGHAWAGLWYGGVLLLAGSVVALVWDCRVFGRVERPDRTLKFIRAAYTWLLLSLTMLVLLPVYQFVVLPSLAPDSASAHLGFSHVYYGAIRHAITVGFVSLMIVGVAARVVPALNGVEAARLSRLWLPFVLLNAGCALRVTTQALTDFTSVAFVVTGLSGLLEVTGLVFWAVHLWTIMAGCPRLRPVADEPERSRPYQRGEVILPSHRVGDVLDAQPALLEMLIALGFRPLANPLLRRIVARRVTLGQACEQLGLDEVDALTALNRAVGHPVPQRYALPMMTSS